MVKQVSAFRLSNNNIKWRWWIQFTGCLYRQAVAQAGWFFKGWQLLGAMLM